MHVTTQAFDNLGPEDGVVPHTPVLEAKQLPMANQGQTIPSTPSEPPTSAVPQLAVSAVSMQSSGGECVCCTHCACTCTCTIALCIVYLYV